MFQKICLVIVALLVAGSPAIANAQGVRNCRITASKGNVVSVGFPLRAERLANLTHPKILVLPYQLKGEPQYEFTGQDQEVFKQAAQNISELSNNKSNINFIFNKTVSINTTADQLDTTETTAKSNWQFNFDDSTYGFVAKTLNEVNQKIDFKGIDAVILFCSSIKKNQSIAEAMMFTNDTTLISSPKKTLGEIGLIPLKLMKVKS